ncbi:MAG: ATP-binding protein [Gammaproteobacteria bacterium]|nr:ATP-binding protein [Gammaproteobacteria bacterium]MDH3750029.1 ATP-binding protein [Gammaproteobacteria bacterium]
MLRAFLAALAVAVLLTVLTLLTIESRSVTEEYYIAHANRVRAIETSKDDLAAIIQGAESAFEEGRSIPEAVNLAFPRLIENDKLLQAMRDTLRDGSPVAIQLSVYDAALSKFIDDGQAFAKRQNALAEALRTMQEESPIVVKELRRFNLRIQSQNIFSLAIEIIEFATGQRSSNVARVQARIDALREDAAVDSTVPGLVDEFAAAATLVLSERGAAENALEHVSKSRIRDHLWVLSDEVLSENRRTVGRADKARLLLSICAALLLIGTGYAMVQLQKSYRELNRSNAELSNVNDSLEDRVASRTEELSAAYDDLKESQVQLVQAEKMSSLGELVAGISHEINTPLYYLTSNATVIQERLAVVDDFFDIAEKMIAAVAARESVKEAISRGLLDMRSMFSDGMKEDIEEARDLIQDSIDGLDELSELAQSLKDFSRLDRAKQGEFNVNDGLDKTLLIVKNRIKNKVTVHKHYEDIPVITCSPSQINQIFLNLITNASDAIEDSGELVLRTWQEDRNVCVSIGDSGRGIPADLLSKIRDPFFTTKEVGKGTGLGLSIVDQIVTSHQGELDVVSQPGKGTVVTLTLPIFASAKEEDSGESAADGPIEDQIDDSESVAVTELPAGLESGDASDASGESVDETDHKEATA